MAGYGITALLCTNGTVLNKGKNLWIQNQTMNKWFAARDLLAGHETTQSFLVRIGAQFGTVAVDVVKFNSNNNIVSVSELYPERSKEKLAVVFVKMKGILSLLTLGSKTLPEWKLAGLDFTNESKVPFLVNERLESINLCI